MKSILFSAFVFIITSQLFAQQSDYNNNDFSITEVTVTHKPELGVTVWEISVAGTAGNTTPVKAGQLDGAPVFIITPIAYMIPFIETIIGLLLILNIKTRETLVATMVLMNILVIGSSFAQK